MVAASDEPGAPATTGLPMVMGFAGAAVATLGFGAGFGASSYRRSVAFKELMEKFPEPPTAEAEQLARSGATRAFVYGTGLAGLMGVGAVLAARAYGIRSAEDFGDAVKKWLPSKEGLEGNVAPKLAPLQRSITEHMQAAREASSGKFQNSRLGRTLSERAETSAKVRKPLEPWEKELVAKLEGTPPAQR